MLIESSAALWGNFLVWFLISIALSLIAFVTFAVSKKTWAWALYGLTAVSFALAGSFMLWSLICNVLIYLKK